MSVTTATPPKASMREFIRKGKPPTEDYRELLFELEAKGELEVQRVPEPYVKVETKYGRKKKIPLEQTWHHKSCGQCGHIPGYSTAIFWLNRKLGYEYHDPRDQTSCTAWNYYASSTSNSGAQAAVAVRNFAQAKLDGFFPMIHCGTSYGHYKEVREEILHHPKLRDQVRKIMDRLKMPFVFPEEIVHYSEWIHVVRKEISEKQVLDFSDITATVHPACHYHKLVVEDAIYDRELYDGQRTAIVTALVEALDAKAADYSTWHDCCGFGFRHILVSRDFSRSFATIRKIERMKEEADFDKNFNYQQLIDSNKCPTRPMFTVWDISSHSKYHGAHFAVYPPELIKVPILATCPPEGIVLDPFVGSGTTCVVAKDLNRKYIGIDISEEYAKLARDRIPTSLDNFFFDGII